MTTAPFDPYRRNYRSLSVKDLLDARESRHVQLMAMDNVIGTAIGLYRIHRDSPDHKNDDTAAAATRVLALMRQCQRLIPPEDLCTLYNKNHTGGIKSGGDPIAAKALFKVYGKKTAVCIANGSKLLATLWISAFHAGGGTDNTLANPVTDPLLRSVYTTETDTFVPSYTLGQWIDHVTGA